MQRLWKHGVKTGVGGKLHAVAADAGDNGEEGGVGLHGEGGWGPPASTRTAPVRTINGWNGI